MHLTELVTLNLSQVDPVEQIRSPLQLAETVRISEGIPFDRRVHIRQCAPVEGYGPCRFTSMGRTWSTAHISSILRNGKPQVSLVGADLPNVERDWQNHADELVAQR
jgi:hypothetical protein